MSEGPARWWRSGSVAVAAVAALVLLALGLVSARPDIAVLAAPLAAVAAAGARRSSGASRFAVEVRDAGGGALAARVRIEAPGDADLAVLRLVPYGERGTTVVVAAHRAPVEARLPVLHTGRQSVLEASGTLLDSATWDGVELGRVEGVVAVDPARRPGLIVPAPFEPSPRPGVRPGRRPGDGLDFRDLAPFAPGDRLRRIDWRATARQPAEGDLIVRRTDALAEATVLVLLDTRDDVGERVAEWTTRRPARTGAGSLDLARDAAAALAAAALTAGDRVGVVDLCRPERTVRPGAGRRHLERVRAFVAATDAAGDRPLTPLPPVPGSLVLLVSPFLDDAPERFAILRRAAGHRVVAVDALPPADLALTSELQVAAHRIVLLEHEARLDALRRADVPVVPWAAGDLASRLLALQRPRVRR